MKFGNYRFLIKFTDDAFLPYYKGSTFRGLLGHAMKRVVCPLKLEDCSSCILRSTCTYALVVKKAEEVKTVKKYFCWTDWKRYSNRQERKMFMGGLTGSVVYEGDFTPFPGIMEMSQKMHVGKNTAFGLGKIKIGNYK